jgi:hypothetical protein
MGLQQRAGAVEEAAISWKILELGLGVFLRLLTARRYRLHYISSTYLEEATTVLE